ncbi:hypothetical protein H7J71_02635 [Mycolicibacterium peregrinum]|uniref:hypothetical protein n=1 Tax=Mycolicibacterium peregrinum TaxID=43304 RepID=UPI001054B763|nr:hypothetical protein [Mycolicibacterium peregrinum]MCV7200907.1 hypothetical protein [Mycolicibacterium peregrinum]
MAYADDPVGYRERLVAKLRPERMRATMAFAGLYQLTHEMIKQIVLDKVRDFFCLGAIGLGDVMTAEERKQYDREVVRLSPKNVFRASLLWLIQMDAITLVQADRLDDVYAHRHDLAHELMKYIVDPDHEPDVDLLADAIAILRDLHRFWIDVELGIGSFEHVENIDEVDPDEIVPLSMMILQQCLDAYNAGLVAP